MKKPSGFTIIELMIATTILSVILVLVSAMAIKIGSLYTKGVNQSKIQDNVRTAMDEITQHLQLMGGSTAYQQAPTPTSAGALCIDSTRYTYVLDKQIGTNSPHVLWRDTMTSPATSNTTCTPATLTNNDPSSGTGGTNGQELEAPNSRLTAFCIGSYVSDTCTIPTTTSSPFSITIGMAYGDTDLTSNKGISTTCDKNIGDHYCATAYLSTIVDQRVGSVGGGTTSSNTGSCDYRPTTTISAGVFSYHFQLPDYDVSKAPGNNAAYPFFTTTYHSSYHGPIHQSYIEGSSVWLPISGELCLWPPSSPYITGVQPPSDLSGQACTISASFFPDNDPIFGHGPYMFTANSYNGSDGHAGFAGPPGTLQRDPTNINAYFCVNGAGSDQHYHLPNTYWEQVYTFPFAGGLSPGGLSPLDLIKSSYGNTIDVVIPYSGCTTGSVVCDTVSVGSGSTDYYYDYVQFDITNPTALP